MMSYLDINTLCWTNDMCIRLSFHTLRDSHTLSFMAMNIGRKKSKQIGMDSFLLGQHNVSYCTGRLVAVIFNYHINDHIVSFFILLLLKASWMYLHITINCIKIKRWDSTKTKVFPLIDAIKHGVNIYLRLIYIITSVTLYFQTGQFSYK